MLQKTNERRWFHAQTPGLMTAIFCNIRDHGFIASEDDYVQQRIKIQLELEQLTPVPEDELEQAANILASFGSHWEQLEGDEAARHDLVKLIVERVYVNDDRVVAMTLRSNYHLVQNHKTNGPTEFTVDPLRSTSGSDGYGALTCISAGVAFLPRYVTQSKFVRQLL